MRSVSSAQTDPYLSMASAAAALAGPLHGGANEEVLKMLDEIGSKDKVPAYIKKVKEAGFKLMGFGHRIYKNHDPRAKIIKWTAQQVFEVTGRNPKLEIALDKPSYNYIIHTSPFDTQMLPHYHWHMEIIPRMTRVAGFEWGTGFYINPVPPEQAAAYLREVEVDVTKGR